MIQYGIPENKISTVHNFTDVSNIIPNFSVGEYVLYFGRVDRSKGILTLIKAAAPLKNIPLYIVGEGEAMSEVEQIIEENGCEHIHLLGFKQGDELRELILNSMCTILPSEWYENCPMSILESFAYGKPVIGTNMGGIPELIEDEVDGFLVPPGEHELLRERLRWMCEHKTEVVEMGKAARKKMETQFNADIHYQKIMDVYRKFL